MAGESEKLDRVLALLEAQATQLLEIRARSSVTEAFSKAVWRLSMPTAMRKSILARFTENLRGAEALNSDPVFGALVHDAARELLAALGEDYTDPKLN